MENDFLLQWNKNKHYYPLADLSCAEMPTRGKYADGYPRGAVIHFTAGRSKGDADAKNTIAYGAKQGHAYFCISSTGTVFQPMPLLEWGRHAGRSSHEDLGGGDLSNRLVGIEMCCAGPLTKTSVPLVYRSWFGEKYYRVRSFAENADNVKKGYYHKFTKRQEEALLKLLLWLKSNNPEVFQLDYVLGHDEIAPDRKSDPGGSLSMTMPQYRKFLKEQWASKGYYLI